MSRWYYLLSLILLMSPSQSGIGPHAQDQTPYRTFIRRLLLSPSSYLRRRADNSAESTIH